MDWLVLEELDDAGARLVALRVIDGERRVLYEATQDAALRPALHPTARRAAIDVRSTDAVKGRARARVALVDLERPGHAWLEQSLDPRWQLGGLSFSADGRLFALEAAYDGAVFPDIFVHRCSFTANGLESKLIGGVRNPMGLACTRPVFVPGSQKLVYLRQTRPDGGWVPAVIDPSREGAAETTPAGLAPGLYTAVLADGIDIVPDAGLLLDARGARFVCATRVRGGTRQQLVAVPLDGRKPRPIGRSHGRIESPALSADGRRVAYSADGRVWLGLMGGEMQPVAGEAGGEHHRGLEFTADGERLLFVTHGTHGATIDAVELAAGVPYPIAQLGDVTIARLMSLPADAALAAALAARPETARAPEPEPESPGPGLLGPDTAIGPVTTIDHAADGDSTLAGDSTMAGDDDIDQTMAGDDDLDGRTDPGGLDSTAVHTAIDLPDDDDSDATKVNAIVEMPAEPAPAPKPVRRPLPQPGSRPAPLPRPGALRPAPAKPLPARTPRSIPTPLGDADDDDERTVINPGGVPPEVLDPQPPPLRSAQLPAPPDDDEDDERTVINVAGVPAVVTEAAPQAPPVSLVPQPDARPVVRAPATPPDTDAPSSEPPDDSVLDMSMSSMSSMDGDSPRADFEGWMGTVAQADDPGARLAELSRYAGDARVGIAAVAWLEAQLERLALQGDAATLDLIFAISAVAHLRLDAARPQLRAMCRKALDRLEMQRAIPEAEEHFALAALRAIDDATVDYAAMAVYDEYQTLLTKIGEAMAVGGDIADRTRTLYLNLYRQRLNEALSPTAAEETDAAAREALELAAQQELARERAEAERAAAEAAIARAADEAARRAKAEAARRAAAQVGAALAHRASVAEDAQWAARRAAVEAGGQEDEWARRRAEAEARAAQPAALIAPMRGQPQQPVQPQQPDPWAAAQQAAQQQAAQPQQPDPWAAAQQSAQQQAAPQPAQPDPWAAAQQAAQQQAAQPPVAADPWVAAQQQARQTVQQASSTPAPDPWAGAPQARSTMQQGSPAQAADAWVQAQRAASPAPADPWAAQQAQTQAQAQARADADDWAAQRAMAEQLAREEAARANATPQDRFNPLATASSLPVTRIPTAASGPTPAVRQPRPAPAPQGRPSIDAFGGGGFADSGMWSESALSRVQVGPAPKALSAIAFAGVAAGVCLALIGIKAGAGFIAFGMLWLAGGLALLADRRVTWMIGMAAFALNAGFLVAVGAAGTPPPWIAPFGLVAGGLAAAIAGGCLLLPVFRDRYRADRQRF